MLTGVSATEVLAHRIVWSLGFVIIIVCLRGQRSQFCNVLFDWRQVASSLLSALIIGLNWGIYIWAVTHGYVLQTSLGYFISPLLSVCLGVLVLGELLSPQRKVAVAFAVLGCFSMTWFVGEIPWIALFLAGTFAIYGYMRKMSALGSILGLALETLLLTPVALIYLFYLSQQGTIAFGQGAASIDILLCGAGIVTAVPLLLFAESTRRIPLSVTGLLQYISPTAQFFLAIFFFKESFGFARFGSFLLIWIGLVIFSAEYLKKNAGKLT